MKNLLTILFSLVFAATAMATTKTVSQDGSGDFTSIQAAIDSFTTAEITDGEPDEVVILDAAEYDEQIAVNLPEITASTAGDFLDAAIETAASRDPFTIRGADADARPIIDPISIEGKSYGVFPGDPGDNFTATINFMGVNLTFENLEVRRSGAITDIDGDDQYGMNGQAGNTVFRNVLFQQMGGGESLINFNNNAAITANGFDNSYTFENCQFNGSPDDSRGNVTGIYFHGISDGDASGAGVDPANVGANVVFDGCEFRNFERITQIRARQQPNNITVRNSFVTRNRDGFYHNGNGELLIENSIFANNTAEPGDIDQSAGAIMTNEREQITGSVTISNSLFVDNLNADEFQGALGLTSRPAVILIRNGNNANGLITVENSTFVNNPVVFRFSDPQGREREGVVNNNIFQNSSVAVLTADDVDGGYLTAENITESGESLTLMVSGTGNVFDGNAIVVETGELLPNVTIEGEELAVTFENPAVDPADPFAGPPYIPDVDAGANLGEGTSVAEFMLY